MGSSTFDLPHNIRNALLWVRTDKHMHMVYMAFHGKNINVMGPAFLCCQFFKALFNTGYLKDFSTVSRTKNQMIVEQ